MTTEEEERSIWEHTEELVSRIRTIIFAFIITTVIVSFIPASWFSLDIPPSSVLNSTAPDTTSWFGEYFYGTVVMYVFHRLEADLLPPNVTIFASGFFDVVWIYFLIALLLGMVLSSPVTIYEIFRFVNPAFKTGEKRFLFFTFTGFSALFLLGASIAYFFIVPVTFDVFMFFVWGTGVQPWFTIRDFIEFTAMMIFGSGLCFTFPVFTSLLVKAGLIDSKGLSGSRRTAFIGILILAAIITPDPTPVSMGILALPMLLLFEVSILVAKRIEKGEKERS